MLVLMSNGHPYDQFRSIWRKYMKSHPNIDCYFYVFHPNLFTPYLLTDDTLIIRGTESLGTVWDKTILAFRYFVNMRPKTYKFLYRTNASSLVDLGKYYERCKTFPTENFCSAVIGYPGPVREHPVDEMPSGSGYTLSFDLVKRFARDTTLKQIVMDDVTIGYYLQEWKIPIVPAPRYDFIHREYSEEEVDKLLSEHFHYRFKAEPTRVFDIAMMNTVADRIYNKK